MFWRLINPSINKTDMASIEVHIRYGSIKLCIYKIWITDYPYYIIEQTTSIFRILKRHQMLSACISRLKATYSGLKLQAIINAQIGANNNG